MRAFKLYSLSNFQIYNTVLLTVNTDFPSGSAGKESTCNVGDTGDLGLIPRSRRFPGGGHGNPLQYSCQENHMDRGAWWAAIYGVTQSQTQLKQLSSSSSEGAKLLSSNQKVLYLWQIFVPVIFQFKCWWKIKRTVCYICASIYYTLLTGPLELYASKKGLSLCCRRCTLLFCLFNLFNLK